MILKVPITGTLKEYVPGVPELTIGDEDDPIRPICFEKLLPEELCSFIYRLIKCDFETGIGTLDIVFSKITSVLEWDNTKTPPEAVTHHKETDAEFYTRQEKTEQALRALFENKTPAELFAITKEPGLAKPVPVGG